MTALVLSGSGALYPAHLGATQRLFEAGLRPSKLIGTSGGAIVASFLSTGKSPLEALEYAKKILPKDILAFNWKSFLFDDWGVLTLKKLQKTLDKNGFVPDLFCHCKIPLYVITTDVNTQKTFVFSSTETPTANVALAVRASASVPILFDVVKINNGTFVDGGVTDNFAIDLVAGHVVGIRLMSKGEGTKTPPHNWPTFLMSVLGSMMSEIERKHVEDSSKFAKTISIELPFNGLDFYAVDEKVIQDLYKAGYEAVDKKIASGWSWSKEA